MTPIIEDSILDTDLDAQFHDLLNINALLPAPANLVSSDDPRLTDGRVPIPGSVVDASVSATAGIQQSKLNFNGPIPLTWLGITAITAAQGDLAEYLSNKNVPLGYCGLDATGKVPPAQLPGTTGTGTVTSVGLTMPSSFTVSGSPITSAGSFSVAWNAVTDLSWFGNNSGAAGPPQFYTTPLPLSLIPPLDASMVQSGVLDPARLPIAVGVGPLHAPGAVPDPGDLIGDAQPTDFLARDMTYQKVPLIGPTYQPVCPGPTLSISAGPPYIVTITATLVGSSLFYSIDNAVGGFAPVPANGQVTINSNQIVYAYAARSGYTNSNIEVMPAPGAPPEELVVTGDPINPSEVVTGDDALDVTVG